MKKISYQTNMSDFLDFHLYAASKSDRIAQKEKNNWLILTIGFALIAVYFFFRQNLELTIYFGLVALIGGLFYRRYFKWRCKVKYKKHIEKNLSDRIGQVEHLQINSHGLVIQDAIGTSTIKNEEVELINETQDHFFININAGLAVIIPKMGLSNMEDLKAQFISKGWEMTNEQSWEWK